MDSRLITSTRRQFAVASTAAVAAMVTGSGATMARGVTPSTTPVASPVTGAPDMHGAVYPFEIGSFSCLAVSDGAFAGQGLEPLLFAQTPPEVVERVLAETSLDLAQVVAQKTSIVIDTGAEMVLVDTGSGAGAGPNVGLLMDNLQSAGIVPDDIDVVVLTHGHADHVSGNVTTDGTVAFPNARFVMSQEDWDFWSDEQTVLETYPEAFAQGHLDSFQRNLLPLEDMFDLIDYDQEIVTGIMSVAAQGHTPGHMGLRIESDGTMLWVLGDAALHPIDLQYPELAGIADAVPDQMIETRRNLFTRLTEEGGTANFNHFAPFPSLGEVVSEGETWAWEPVETGTASPMATPVS